MVGLPGLPIQRSEAAPNQHPIIVSGARAGTSGPLATSWIEALAGLEPESLLQSWQVGREDLGACLDRQFSTARKVLEARLGPAGSRELLALAGEKDPELQAEAWLGLARRQQQSGRIESAAWIYERLAAAGDAVGKKALREFEAIHGRGAVGPRVEFLLSQFAEQASDPAMLGGMMVASTVFQGARLAGLTRLLANPHANWLTRGVGARALASALGFTAEVPAFLVSSKGIHQMMGRPQDWSPRALAREGAALGITLLFLKGFGAAGRQGVLSLHTAGPRGLASGAFTRASASLIPQAASLAGIYFGHRAEAAMGLVPQVDDATALTDSLIFLLQFHVGGKLSSALMGPKFAAELRRMEWLSDTLGPPPKSLSGISAISPVEGLAVAGTWRPISRPVDERPHFDIKPLQMSLNGAGEVSSYRFLEHRLRQHLQEKLVPGPEADTKVRERFQRMIEDIGETFLKTQHVDLQRYYQLMLQSRLTDIAHEDGRTTTRIEQLAVAVKCFAYAMEMNPLRRAVGSHYDSLIQEAFERTLKEGTPADFEALVRVAGVSRRLESVENFLQERGWAARYAFLPETPAAPAAEPTSWRDRLRQKFQDFLGRFSPPPAPPPQPEWTLRLRSLHLSPESLRAVERYLQSYSASEAAAPFRDSNHNYVLWRPEPRDLRRESFTPEVAVEGLADYLRTWKSHPAYLKVLEDAIRRAADKPVPLLHFDRIFKVLSTRDLPHKIAEVASFEEFNWGRLQGYLELSQAEPGVASAARKLNGTIYTGYIYDKALAEKFALLYLHSGLFLREHEDRIRLGRFHATVDELLRDVSKYGQEDVIRLLELDRGPDARIAVAALKRGQADLRMVSREELRRMGASLPDHRRVGNQPRVIYVPPSQNGGRRPVVYVAEKSCFDEADVVYMLKLQPTPVADQARKAIESGEIDLQVMPKAELRAFHDKLDSSSKGEPPPQAFYVPAKKSPHGRPIIVVEALDPQLSRDMKIWQSIFLPARVVHEFEHHLHRDIYDDVFHSEMRAWLEETYFLMYNGELRDWREMQETSPYGFGVYLRNLVDKNYIEGPRHVSRKK